MPVRLSFAPSKSTYRLGGDLRSPLMHDRGAEISLAVETKVVVVMVDEYQWCVTSRAAGSFISMDNEGEKALEQDKCRESNVLGV